MSYLHKDPTPDSVRDGYVDQVRIDDKTLDELREFLTDLDDLKTLDELNGFLTDLADLNVDEPTRIALLAAREYIAEDNNPKSNRVLALIHAALNPAES